MAAPPGVRAPEEHAEEMARISAFVRNVLEVHHARYLETGWYHTPPWELLDSIPAGIYLGIEIRPPGVAVLAISTENRSYGCLGHVDFEGTDVPLPNGAVTRARYTYGIRLPEESWVVQCTGGIPLLITTPKPKRGSSEGGS